jgi:hypothetical protein
MIKTFILLRFYEDNRISESKVIKCKEEDLLDHLIKFKAKGRNDERERIGIIEEDEFYQIAKELK